VRASGYAARGRRPSNTHVRPVTGLALAHLRDLLARHGIEPSQGNRGWTYIGTGSHAPTWYASDQSAVQSQATAIDPSQNGGDPSAYAGTWQAAEGRTSGGGSGG
jgi:hypothetical protein